MSGFRLEAPRGSIGIVHNLFKRFRLLFPGGTEAVAVQRLAGESRSHCYSAGVDSDLPIPTGAGTGAGNASLAFSADAAALAALAALSSDADC